MCVGGGGGIGEGGNWGGGTFNDTANEKRVELHVILFIFWCKMFFFFSFSFFFFFFFFLLCEGSSWELC